jgi:hypothetical protein
MTSPNLRTYRVEHRINGVWTKSLVYARCDPNVFSRMLDVMRARYATDFRVRRVRCKDISGKERFVVFNGRYFEAE